MINKSKDIKYSLDRIIKLKILEFNVDGSCNAELDGNKFRVFGVIPVLHIW